MDWPAAIEAIRKPLEFAAAGDFSRADRVKDLERTVVGATERASKLSAAFCRPLSRK